MMHQPTELSIVIPCFNEEQRIGSTLEDIAAYLNTRPWTYEVIVVDDGSIDETENAARQHGDKIMQLQIVAAPTNRGKGHAVQCGMSAARGRYRLFMDADHSVSICYIDQFLAQAKQGHHVVIGSIEIDGAVIRDECAFWRRALGRLSKVLIRFLVIPHIRDSQRGFKLFSEVAAQEIFSHQTIDGFGFDIEILYIAQKRGYSIKELPVVWNNTRSTSIGVFTYFSTLGQLFRIFWNKMRGKY